MMNFNLERDNLEKDEESIDKNIETKRNERDHFASTYTLKPDDNYESKGYIYRTDKFGRIIECQGTLRIEDGKRNTDHQTRAGGEYRLETDEGGHLIGTQFGGSEKIDNLVPMDFEVNRKDYYKIEKDWAKELEKGNRVDVKIRSRYFGESTRPKDFIVLSRVTDKDGFVIGVQREQIDNQRRGK